MVPVGLNSPRGPPTVGLSQTQLDIEGLGEVLGCQGVVERTGGHDAPALQQQDGGDAGRNLLDVMCDQHRGGCVLISYKLAKGVDERLAASQIQACGGLV